MQLTRYILFLCVDNGTKKYKYVTNSRKANRNQVICKDSLYYESTKWLFPYKELKILERDVLGLHLKRKTRSCLGLLCVLLQWPITGGGEVIKCQKADRKKKSYWMLRKEPTFVSFWHYSQNAGRSMQGSKTCN